ncbi:MAG TPA: phage holin family protein [Bacillus sp. (in: firmicutes)]|uniref:phage holin family protein n=1 Tax=Bacillus litorisediminis TaxID=2922713 RepID=UPI001FADB98A|nr:phage holin family protein [Bacillus litorisediminis]HWO75689.1 phage holin family protein [Bacillus sp. (in: firmicutes)]
MEIIRTFTIPFISCVGSVLSVMYGGWNHIFLLLIIAVILDYGLGVLLAFMNGSLSSNVGWKGIAKKVIIFSLIAVAHIVDVVLDTPHLVRNATILFYLCNECISIIEHAAKAGVPIPKALMNALESIRPKENKNPDQNHDTLKQDKDSDKTPE